ncbi:MAG: MBL fold metallo-hydrolase [Steroidobacteraceae bacterium]
MTSHRKALFSGILAILVSGDALMSTGSAAPIPDSEAALAASMAQHLEQARVAAGRDFVGAANMFCLNARYGGDVIGDFWAGRRMTDADADFEPIEVFDGVFYVGLREIGAYAIKTSAGVILIDALPTGQVRRFLVPHLKKVGIDPRDVKYVVVTHGHADHYGGAAYFQGNGATVFMTAPDWDLLDKQAGESSPPRRDVAVKDGDVIRLGDTALRVVFTPGHTPGALSLLMSVKDHGAPHTAMLFGGAGWGLAAMPMPMRPIYSASLEHMEEVARANKVDVLMEGHPFLSNTLLRMAQVRERAAGAPHPLVIGEEGYLRWLDVVKECHAASTDRYRALTAAYGDDARKWPRLPAWRSNAPE